MIRCSNLNSAEPRTWKGIHDVGVGYWDTTYENHIICEREFGMAVKWAVDVWSHHTIFCPCQSLLSTYSICFRKCKLQPLALYRQNMDSAVGATCNVSTRNVFSHGFRWYREKTEYVSLPTILAVFSSVRCSLSEQFWKQIFPTAQKQGVGTTSSCKTHLWLFPTPARSLFAIRPCRWIDSEQLCISLSLSSSWKVGACISEEHLKVLLQWLRKCLLVSWLGKGEGSLLRCSSTVKYRFINVNKKWWKYAFLLLHEWNPVALLVYTVAPLSLGYVVLAPYSVQSEISLTFSHENL